MRLPPIPIAVLAALAAVQAGAAPLLYTAARLLDVRTGQYVAAAGVVTDGGKIVAAGAVAVLKANLPPNVRTVDLGNRTLMPGLIDAHTHIMARIPDGDTGYVTNLATRSEAARALDGAANARATLRAGFTTVRDVGNEGGGYADVALRDAIKAGLVEGPRMRVATRAIASVGQYHPFDASPDLHGFPTGAQMVSGVEDARRAAREQIGHGADLIKVYADWNAPTLTVDELRVVVEEAHRAGIKVACHATKPEGIRNAIAAGVDSIEHGSEADAAVLKEMKVKGIFLVPTLAAIDEVYAGVDTMPPARAARVRAFLAKVDAMMKAARTLGVRMALGFDATAPGAAGNDAREAAAMVARGLTPIEAIRAATVDAADLLGWADKVGSLEAGHYADIIAIDGDPLADIGALSRVAVVIKGGEIVRDTR